ncbi:hypothetical protein F2Q70_00028844 [Brassica cretica]|uniref:Uncharacterized protein n=1 Tax=Brassica cretica TaxID=69181 RepID=A0A8S9LCP9_BRACR|nr:hypothetical protein F2Q70_00028844 [Brassica cretica]
MRFPNPIADFGSAFDDCSQDDCEVESKGALKRWMIEKDRSLPSGVFLRVSNVEAFTIRHLLRVCLDQQLG